jgi:hypothetical protein
MCPFPSKLIQSPSPAQSRRGLGRPGGACPDTELFRQAPRQDGFHKRALRARLGPMPPPVGLRGGVCAASVERGHGIREVAGAATMPGPLVDLPRAGVRDRSSRCAWNRRLRQPLG